MSDDVKLWTRDSLLELTESGDLDAIDSLVAELNQHSDYAALQQQLEQANKHIDQLKTCCREAEDRAEHTEARVRELEREVDGEGGPIPITTTRDPLLKCAVCDHSEQEFLDLKTKLAAAEARCKWLEEGRSLLMDERVIYEGDVVANYEKWNARYRQWLAAESNGRDA